MWTLPAVEEALRHATEAGEVPGVVVAAATQRGMVYEAAFGKRAIGKPDPMTTDSVFWIASMTKAITCAAAMQLVESGKLELDESIETVLPQLAARQVLEVDSETGETRLRPAKRAISLRQLMTHTSGFAYNMWNARLAAFMERNAIPGVASCTEKALTIPLSSDPGERWEYGIGIDFVGKAVEAASGERLDVYLEDHIFAPLGMRDTRFKLGESQRGRLVSMHARAPDGTLSAIAFEIPQEPEFHMGGGGLYSTARDYIAFIRMLLGGGTLDGARLLKPETVALMAQNHIGDLSVTKLPSAMANLSNDVELFPEQEKKWGLSFLINTRKTAQGRSPGSLAWAGLGNTYFWTDPSRQIGGVILTQILPFADPGVLRLFGEFESGIYRELDRQKRAA